MQKTQRSLKSGQLTLYHTYRNRVNKARKTLQEKDYQEKVPGLGKHRPSQWWRDIKSLVGAERGDNDLQGIANMLCDGNMQALANRICDFFQSVT